MSIATKTKPSPGAEKTAARAKKTAGKKPSGPASKTKAKTAATA